MEQSELLKNYREKIKLSQTDFADRLGVSRELLSNMETGKAPITNKTKKLLVKEFSFDMENFTSVVNEDDIKLEKPAAEKENYSPDENIRELIKSHGTLSDTVKINAETVNTLALSNKMLADMVQSSINLNNAAKQPRTIAQILAPYLHKMARAGIPDLWPTEDDGIVKLGRLLVVDVAVAH